MVDIVRYLLKRSEFDGQATVSRWYLLRIINLYVESQFSFQECKIV